MGGAPTGGWRTVAWRTVGWRGFLEGTSWSSSGGATGRRAPVSAVVVAGLGYVGLPLAMRAVAAGHEVAGYDADPVRVKRLEAGESYVEDVSASELATALKSGRVPGSAEAGLCPGLEFAVVTVP